MVEKLFPVLELEMTAQGMKVRLADEKAMLSASLPKEMMEGIVAQWQQFQAGETPLGMVYSRHYTGEWPDLLRKEQ